MSCRSLCERSSWDTVRVSLLRLVRRNMENTFSGGCSRETRSRSPHYSANSVESCGPDCAGDSVCWHVYFCTLLTRKGDYLSISLCVCVTLVLADVETIHWTASQNAGSPPPSPQSSSLDSPQWSICESHSPCQTVIQGERGKNPPWLLNALWSGVLWPSFEYYYSIWCIHIYIAFCFKDQHE